METETEIKYAVNYKVTDPKYTDSFTVVSLREGYSDFEDIRGIVAISRGVRKEQIIIKTLALIEE